MMYAEILKAPPSPVPEERLVHSWMRIGALELFPEGRRLKSGRISPYFFNSAVFNNGQLLWQLAESYASAAKNRFDFDVIFGPAYKGIPLATATAMILSQNPIYDSVGYVFNRKESKDHGEGGKLVGASVSNQRVLIVEDVITTGSSGNQAVDDVKNHGGEPVGCIVSFDRQERGTETRWSAVQEFQGKTGVTVKALATFTHLINFVARIRHNTKGGEGLAGILQQLNDYQKEYGTP